MRDIEDMMLNTLVSVISNGTGIPSGNIWLHVPEPEFVNKRSGSHDPSTNEDYLPAVGITYMKDATIKHNNYGGTRFERLSSTVGKEYATIGELNLCLAINLFTSTHEEMNELSALLYQTILRTRAVNYLNDSIQGEYFSILFKSMRYTHYQKPIRKIFFVELNGRILSESTGYVVKELVTSIDTFDDLSTDVVSGVIVTVKHNPDNPLVVDDSDEFDDGIFVRTV